MLVKKLENFSKVGKIFRQNLVACCVGEKLIYASGVILLDQFRGALFAVRALRLIVNDVLRVPFLWLALLPSGCVRVRVATADTCSAARVTRECQGWAFESNQFHIASMSSSNWVWVARIKRAAMVSGPSSAGSYS
jgi:hypothetical protein